LIPQNFLEDYFNVAINIAFSLLRTATVGYKISNSIVVKSMSDFIRGKWNEVFAVHKVSVKLNKRH
jgi:hypothetical protein